MRQNCKCTSNFFIHLLHLQTILLLSNFSISHISNYSCNPSNNKKKFARSENGKLSAHNSSTGLDDQPKRAKTSENLHKRLENLLNGLSSSLFRFSKTLSNWLQRTFIASLLSVAMRLKWSFLKNGAPKLSTFSQVLKISWPWVTGGKSDSWHEGMLSLHCIGEK